MTTRRLDLSATTSPSKRIKLAPHPTEAPGSHATIVGDLMNSFWRRELEAELRVMEETRTAMQQRHETELRDLQGVINVQDIDLHNQTNLITALRRRLNRTVQANRVITATNNTLRTMNNNFNDILHDIFASHPAIRRQYQGLVRFPDLTYTDDSSGTETEMEDLSNEALDMFREE